MTIASGLVALTCSSSREQGALSPSAHVAPALSAQAPAPAAESAVVAAPDVGAGERDASADEERTPPRGELGRFYAALRGLEQKARKEHVRIVWLGDSHGASDFWSGRVRTALQKRFGDGGIGYVHLGWRAYRHDGVKLSVDGKWRSYPKGPSTVLATGDGVFGLGGILWRVGDDAGGRATVTVEDNLLGGKLAWDLCYKMGSKDDELIVHVGGSPKQVLRVAQTDQLKRLQHFAFTTQGPGASLSVSPGAGRPELCGVIIEADPAVQPGIVLDTLGINGARMATPLAWEESSWGAELGRRAPSLVILQFGTNESGDRAIKPRVYGDHLAKVLARIRKVAPDTDCLVLGPTDRADTIERTPEVRDALRDAAAAKGCGFFDAYAAMGGKGSIEIWRKETPPRAAADGIHLSYRGYYELGDKLLVAIMAGYGS